MTTNTVDTIFKESFDKLNSILLYLDHQLGTVSLTKEEVESLGGVKNEVQPAHTILDNKKDQGKEKGKGKEQKENKKENQKENKKENKKENQKENKKEEENKTEQKSDKQNKKKKDKKKDKNENKEEEDKKEEDKKEEDKKDEKKEEPAKKVKQQKKGMDSKEIFKLCDLRVGYVEECKIMEGFEDIYSLVIELGEPQKRIIGTGLRKFVPIDNIKNTKLVVFSNLKPKKFGKDFESNGMILTAGLKEGDKKIKFELLRPDENAKPGDKVYLDGTELDPKKEEIITGGRFKQAMDHFKTDEDCFCTYDGTKIRTETGFIKAAIKNAPIS